MPTFCLPITFVFPMNLLPALLHRILLYCVCSLDPCNCDSARASCRRHRPRIHVVVQSVQFNPYKYPRPLASARNPPQHPRWSASEPKIDEDRRLQAARAEDPPRDLNPHYEAVLRSLAALRSCVTKPHYDYEAALRSRVMKPRYEAAL